MDPASLRVDGLLWNGIIFFRDLPEMCDCIEIYDIAPLMHLEPLTKAHDKFLGYCVSREVLRSSV